MSFLPHSKRLEEHAQALAKADREFTVKAAKFLIVGMASTAKEKPLQSVEFLTRVILALHEAGKDISVFKHAVDELSKKEAL